MQTTNRFSEKMTVAVALIAIGAASAQAQYVPGPKDLELSKPWSLLLDARGFYDDNYLTLPKSMPVGVKAGGAGLFRNPEATWGSEITPAAAVNHSVEDTRMSASYIFDDRWNADHSTMDLTHQFDGLFEHEFGERYKLSVTESFVSAQEPTVIDPGIVTTPFRILGDNKRNTGQLDFTASLTKNFDLHLGYANTTYAYQQIDRSVIGYPFIGFNGGFLPTPSYSDLLDRINQLATVDLQWKASPGTTAIAGYKYGHTDFTSPGYIIYPYGATSPYPFPPGVPLNTFSSGFRSDFRNSDSDYGFVGIDESFTPKLHGSLRAGAEYVDYYNAKTSRVSPYIDARLTYQYLAGDTAELGVQHFHNATDVVGIAGSGPVLDAETTAIFISEQHTFSKKFTVSLTGRVQDSTYVGRDSSFNGKGEDFIMAGVNFTYHFNSWLLAETGYNYSRLTSDLAYREYTRNFGFLGVRATWGR